MLTNEQNTQVYIYSYLENVSKFSKLKMCYNNKCRLLYIGILAPLQASY